MPRTHTRLSRLDDDAPISTLGSHNWDVITELMAIEFPGSHPDDVNCVEDDDGTEIITVCGVRLARLEMVER